MAKQPLPRPYTYSAPHTCRYCKTEVKKKDIIAGRAKELDETTCICPECLLRPKTKNRKSDIKPSVAEKKNPSKSFTVPDVKKKNLSKNYPVPDIDEFVNMIAAAQNDEMIRERVLFLAQLSSFHRTSLLNTLISDMRMQGRRASFLASAIECLKNDDVALKTIEVLTKK